MDSNVVSILIAVGVAVLVFLGETLSQKKGKPSAGAKTERRPSPQRSTVLSSDAAEEERRHAALRAWRARGKQPVARVETPRKTEPATAPEKREKPHAAPARPAAASKRPTGKAGLREAFIWSEILKTKF